MSDEALQKDLRAIERTLEKFMRDSSVTDAQIASDIGYIKASLTELKALVNNHYVTKSEFEPVKKLVYGVVALVLTSVMSALMYLVIK